jgi:hypothetical protein
MKELEATFQKKGPSGGILFRQTVDSIRTSMEAGLKIVFLLGAITMLVSFLPIITIPEISMDVAVEDKKAPQPAFAEETAE